MTVRYAALFFFIALAGYNCARPETTNSTMTTADDMSQANLTLTAKQRSAEQRLPENMRSPEKYKFVEVTVTSVENPGKHSVSFEVYYVAPNNERIFFGTFSLFPADNPGRFIVPTQGKLKGGGKLILTLVLPPEVRDTDPIKVTAREMKLREE